MKITKFDTPIIKSASEMEHGDIFNTEFGDVDNWVDIVYENCQEYSLDCTKIKFHIPNGNLSDCCYSYTPISEIKFKVVGKEEREDQ